MIPVDELNPGDLFVDPPGGSSSFCFYDGRDYWCVAADSPFGWKIHCGLPDPVKRIEPRLTGQPADEVRLGSLPDETVFTLGGYRGTAHRTHSECDWNAVQWLDRFLLPQDTLVRVGPWETFDEVPMGVVFVGRDDVVSVKTGPQRMWCGECRRSHTRAMNSATPYRLATFNMEDTCSLTSK